jgi:hypothetical protein
MAKLNNSAMSTIRHPDDDYNLKTSTPKICNDLAISIREMALRSAAKSGVQQSLSEPNSTAFKGVKPEMVQP